MNNITLRNGEFVSSDIASDRSLLYGDGVFTTLVIKGGEPILLKQHIQRLCHDCQKLKIDNISHQSIKRALFSAIEGVECAIVRITVSRSSGERGYLCKQAKPVYWITVNDWPNHIVKFRKEGISIRICDQLISGNKALAGVKHCNRLEQVLARNEWNSDDYQEGLMLDNVGNVIEGTMSNLFLVKNEQLFTADLTYAGVEGIIRRLIIRIAKQLEIPLTIGKITLEELATAEAIFVTNSVIEIWPVKHFHNIHYMSHPMIQNV